ncbi:MAG: hypothetical protein GXY41_09865 [Phycisphaerae bacterium]|nr:hypothetical protein [Phycisphaerae bacterium]
MKTTWLLLAMLTALLSLSVSVVRVEAAGLELSGASAMDDSGEPANPPTEVFPSTFCQDDGSGEPAPLELPLE